MDTKIDAFDALCIAGMVAAAIWLSGCGYALVKIPSPGERVSMTAEQQISSVFETGLENAVEAHVNPASYFQRRRK